MKAIINPNQRVLLRKLTLDSMAFMTPRAVSSSQGIEITETPRGIPTDPLMSLFIV